jgi:hypothetical protein
VANQPAGEVANATYPVGLNQPRLMASSRTSPSATRNPGIAKPRIDRNWTARSSHPRRVAASTPSATATTALSTVAPRTSDSVTPRREVTATVTS